MNRRITFGSKITLNYKALGGLGLREVVLLAFAAIQAVYWVLVADTPPFAARLVIALGIGLVFMAWAVVPIRGYKIEHFLWLWLRNIVRPRRYLHQTAEAQSTQVVIEDETANAKPKLKAALPSLSIPHLQGNWAGPNMALVMTMFLVLMLISSFGLYITSGGRLHK